MAEEEIEGLIQILEATVSPDTAVLQQAGQTLEQAAQSNLPGFLLMLSMVLANKTKSETSRMAAGLQLKNYLTSKSPEIKVQYQQRWLQMDAVMRTQVKSLILDSLTAGASNRSATQCIATIAAAEIPTNQWPELMPSLLLSLHKPETTDNVRQASLETIGYVCEELDARYLTTSANEILTAIIHSMKHGNDKVKLAATKALYNSLEFTKANFEKSNECDFIMTVVCEATQVSNTPVQVAALQNLVKIMSFYYHLMEPYMGPALFAITLEAIKSPVDEIALQGIEFWSTVCDEEMDLAIEAAEAEEQGRPPEQVSRFYVKGALPHLVTHILNTLTKQDEGDDEDDWNPCKAAGVCLSLMANCCESDIIPYVHTFVQESIMNTEWNIRDAAVMALGSIMEGPNPDLLKQPLFQVRLQLIQCMQDASVQVRDTTAWTIGRICEHVPEVLISGDILQPLLSSLVTGLNAEPRVATNVCWAISSLAEAAYDDALGDDDEVDPPTHCLSLYFEQLVDKLMATSDRADANSSNNLRSAAYEAMMDLIKHSAVDSYQSILKISLGIVEKLRAVITRINQSSASEQQLADVESLLCATLQALLRKVKPEDLSQFSDSVMECLFSIMGHPSGKAGGVYEDAILAISVVVEVLNTNFERYMGAFKDFLLNSLRTYEETAVCSAAIGIVGDLCRSYPAGVASCSNEIMEILLTNLSVGNLNRSLMPPILSAIGDIALALGAGFEAYLPHVFVVLTQVVGIKTPDTNDFDEVDFTNTLREGCLDAFTGIVQGLKGDTPGKISDKVVLIEGHVELILKFLEVIASDEDHTESNVSAGCGLLGDLCTVFGSKLTPLLQKYQMAIAKLTKEGKNSRLTRTSTIATWALAEVSKVLPPS